MRATVPDIQMFTAHRSPRGAAVWRPCMTSHLYTAHLFNRKLPDSCSARIQNRKWSFLYHTQVKGKLRTLTRDPEVVSSASEGEVVEEEFVGDYFQRRMNPHLAL